MLRNAPIFNVMMVEDDSVLRKILAARMAAEPRINLIASFSQMGQALDWLEFTPVDVLLTDLCLPDGSGIELIRTCAQRWPECDILVLTASSDEKEVLECIKAGACGYILKEAGGRDVIPALLEIRSGGSPMTPSVARRLLKAIHLANKTSYSEAPKTASVLGKREIQIVELLARGSTYHDITKTLGISMGTLQNHVKNIYAKLSVHSRSGAVFEAHRQGLLKPSMPSYGNGRMQGIDMLKQ